MKNAEPSRYLSLVTLALGIALALFKITVDSEPGAIPLLLLGGGAVGLALARRRSSNREDFRDRRKK